MLRKRKLFILIATVFVLLLSIVFVKFNLEKQSNLRNEEIIDEIKNVNNTLETKLSMIDLYTANSEDKLISSEMKNLLESNIDNRIKEKLISDSIFSKDDKNMLKKLFLSKYDSVSFQSLKKLKEIDASEAHNISKDLLNNYNNVSELKVSGALKAGSNYFRVNKDNKTINNEKNDFIKKCVDIIENSNKATLKESSVFALSEMNDKKALFILIKNKSIDDIVKTYCIDENFCIIEDILKNNPTEEEFNIILEAMNINPILESIEPIELYINKSSNLDIIEKGKETVGFIRQNGVNATKFN